MLDQSRPLVIEDRKLHRNPPATFEKLLLAQNVLPLHANLLQHAGRRDILGQAVHRDPPHSQRSEAQTQHLVRRFCCVAPTPELRVKLIADVSLS